MSVTVTNLIAGPAGLWVGSFGSAEPTGNAQPVAGSFVDCGGTDGGVDAEIQQNYFIYDGLDQVAGNVDARLTGQVTKISTNLAEATLANFRVALNQLTSAASFVEVDPTLTGQSPNFSAVLLRGMRPGQGGPRTVIMRRGLSTASIKSSYKKDGVTYVPVEFTGFYVSQSIKPFKIDDTP